MKKVIIQTEYIKLDQFLKWAGICDTGGEASLMIAEGEVRVNGEPEFRRGKKLYPGDVVEADDIEYTVIGE